MASVLQQVSEAVVQLIEAGEAAGTFAKSITTERQYDLNHELEDTETISVVVQPVMSNRTRKSEGTYDRDIVLDVIVRKRFPQTDFNSSGKVDRERLDEYVELLEQIDDYLADPDNHVPATYTEACYVEDDSNELDRRLVRQLGINEPWVQQHLIEWQQYTGILRVAYSVALSY